MDSTTIPTINHTPASTQEHHEGTPASAAAAAPSATNASATGAAREDSASHGGHNDFANYLDHANREAHDTHGSEHGKTGTDAEHPTTNGGTSMTEDNASSKDERPHVEPTCTLNIDEGVVEKISSLAAQKVDGIIDMKGNVFSRIQEGLGGTSQKKGVDADVVDDQSACVEVSIILKYGESALDVFDQIKDIVTEDVRTMTGLNVIELTVNIVDVMTPEEFEDSKGGGFMNAIGLGNVEDEAA